MITSVETIEHGVCVVLGARRIELGWTWLRDHSRDPGSYQQTSEQRIVTPGDVAASGPGEVAIATGGGAIDVSWPDGPTTRFEESFLTTLGDAASATAIGRTPSSWTGDQLADRIEPVDFAEIRKESGRRRAVGDLWRDGVVLVTDVPTERAATRAVLERFGYVRSTIFGGLWEFRSDGGFDDTASTRLEITPHTDGTYSHDAPGLLGLHCHVYDATGGDNVFVDAHTIADRLSPASRSVLGAVEIPGRYIGDGAHLMARRPVLRYDGDRLVQVSYNHHDRAPFLLPEPAMSELYAALFEFDELAGDPSLRFEVALRPTDMVLFDNWRVLHGRRSFDGERVMAGGYVNREDVESTTRLLDRG